MTQATNVIRLPKAKEAAIDSLLARTGYDITQENSQRKYGPPPDWKGPPPPRGSEIFIGKVPRDMYEDELVPIVEKIGKIYEMRLMMDFTGQNRGYAFVMYTCPEDAKRAIKELDNTEVKKGRFIGVCKSVDNCRLFVGGIPRTKTKEEIMEEMTKVTDQVCDVILYSSILDKSKNRGFAFVEYESHKAAAMARKKLMPGRIQLWGQDIAVDWAEPELEVDEDIMAKVTVLYVRNLMPSTTEEDIKKSFSLGNSLAIEKVKKLRDFAFVHYRNREDAKKAMDDLHGTDLDGSVIEVTWAKPVDRSTRQRNRSPGPPNTASYNPYLYPFPMDPFSGHVPFAPCQARNPVFPRMSLARRGRGAAGIRRYNRNFPPPANHPASYKHIEIPFVPVPHAYGQYQVASKLSRIPEEGKPYYQSDYSVYAPNSAGADSAESPMTSNAGGPGIPPPHFPAFPRIAQHGYYPMPAAFDDIGYYAIVHPAPPGPPPPSTAPPGPVSMY